MGATLVGTDSSNSAGAGSATALADLTWPDTSLGDRAYLVGVDLNQTTMLASDFDSADTAEAPGTAGVRLFRKVCDGTETGTTGFTLDGTGSRLAGVLVVVSGAAAPVEALLTDSNNSDSTVPIPVVTPSEDGTLLVVIAGLRHGNVGSPSFTPPTGFTEQEATHTSNGSGNVAAAWVGTKQLGASTGGVATASGLVLTSNSSAMIGTTWLLSFPVSGGTGPSPIPSGWVEVRAFTPDES